MVEEDSEHFWQVLAFHKHSGELAWKRDVGRAAPLSRRHFKATQSNSTPVTDGRHLVAILPTAGLVCLDLNGNILWRRDLGGLAIGNKDLDWGFASSPIIYNRTVITQVDTRDQP